MATKKFDDIKDQCINEVLEVAYNALKEKGYNAIGQLAGFIFSDDPSYLTTYNNARMMLTAVDRDELLEHILRYYFEG